MHDSLDPRLLPDFVVLGAMKAGTSTLYHMLAGHPEIGVSRMKETDFFIMEKNWSLGFDWYASQYPSRQGALGEVSPNYTKHDIFPGVPERMANMIPEVRLIFLARDPVARFVSHYQHSWLMGLMKIEPDALLDSHQGRHMIECSRYAAQLDPYFERFPREQLLIVDFARLVETPQSAMDAVCDFLQVSRAPAAVAGAQNERASIARMPAFVQRAWRSRAARLFDPFISREVRDRARRMLSRGPERRAPSVPKEIRAEAARRLVDDAARFRRISGLAFDDWSV